ncbi:MAG: hypothetical protein MHPSP_001166 [Paramarteilia canceri]
MSRTISSGLDSYFDLCRCGHINSDIKTDNSPKFEYKDSTANLNCKRELESRLELGGQCRGATEAQNIALPLLDSLSNDAIMNQHPLDQYFGSAMYSGNRNSLSSNGSSIGSNSSVKSNYNVNQSQTNKLTPCLSRAYKSLSDVCTKNSSASKSKIRSNSTVSFNSNSSSECSKDLSSQQNYDKSRYATRFRTDQNSILNDWYVNNQSMPYATDEKIAELAQKTGLSEKSVRKWLSNKRSRKHNTNNLKTVVAYKRVKEEYQYPASSK